MVAFIARKKSLELEVAIWDGDNLDEIVELSQNPEDILVCDGGILKITTLEGVMLANIGDFIIKGAVGELYPCKAHVFHKSYDILPE
ncbi:MAG: hypothetical protein ACRC0J_06385 [Shewanella oncorhynchi]